MVQDPLSLIDALMVALSGFVIVFIMLALLWGIIAVVSRAVSGVEHRPAAAPAPAPMPAPAPAAPAAAAPAAAQPAPQVVLEGIDENGNISEEAKEKVSQLLKQSFRPEFLNRLDEIVYYKPLTKDNITKIIDLLIKGLAQRLEDKQLKLEITPLAKDLIIENGYDPVYGARPLKRYLQSKVETLIAKTIIANDLQPGNTIEIGAHNGDFTVKVR